MEIQQLEENPKSKNYTEAHKLAQKKYREKYNQSQWELYIKLKQNERSAKNNNIYRQKKKE